MRPSLAVVAAAGYLIGSIPVANLVARRHGVRDLRTVGDRNPGYWNARETIGPRAAAPIFVGDVTKGAAAAGVGAAVGSATGGPWWSASLGGGAAMIGHAVPIFAGGRGGRSVLTFVGASTVAAPRAAAASIATFGAVWVATGRFDRATRVGVAAFPVIQLVVDGPRRTAVSGILMTFVGLRFATAWLAQRPHDPARSSNV
ncbi:MAG: glycerol-3-phosphate acyltransferase [Acidimicrobiia bacterium]